MSAGFDVVQYLASKGYRGRPGGGNEVAYPCFFDCGEDEHSRKRKLYVNAEEGFYTCFVCGASGGTYLLQKHFGDEPKRDEPGQDPYTRLRILRWAAQVGQEMLSANDHVMLHLLNERGLSPETIVDRQLGYVGNRWSLTKSLPESFKAEELANTGLVNSTGGDFYYDHILIPYVSRGQVVQLRGKSWTGKGAKYLTASGDVVRLYNVDS